MMIPPKKCLSIGDTKRDFGGLLEPQIGGTDMRWSKTAMCPPCKGVYTWMSPPKIIPGNKKLTRIMPEQLRYVKFDLYGISKQNFS